MKADIKTAADLFYSPCHYEIPIYQRPYVWDEDDQWEPLWDDIIQLAEGHLNGTIDGEADHFLGAIVLKQLESDPGMPPRWSVIDGQQRLLTMQLILDAAELSMRHIGEDASDHADDLRHLIENRTRAVRKAGVDKKFKVWPTVRDQDDFREAMQDETGFVPEKDASRVTRAHNFFRERVHHWITSDEEAITDRAEAIQITLADRLKLVAISLDPGDNPNVIFETLNARGTPLLAWDLVKNYMLHRYRLHGGDEAHLHEQWFEPIEKDEWWQGRARLGSAWIQRTDLLLYYWLTLRTKKLVRVSDLFSEFRSYRGEGEPTVVAKDIFEVASHFKAVERPENDGPWSHFLQAKETLRAGIITPQLLCLKESGIDDDQLERVLSLFESFFVRRAACGLDTRGGNVAFLPLIDIFEDAGADDLAERVSSFFGKSESAATYYPSNEEFAESLVNSPMYRKVAQVRIRFILRRIERKLEVMTGAVVVGWDKLWIEHVIPQVYDPQEYPLSDDAHKEDESPEEQRARLLHSLGNLSLTTSDLGRKLSNKSWTSKQSALSDDTLALNHDLLKYAPDQWDDDAIMERGNRLADLAIGIWPFHTDI